MSHKFVASSFISLFHVITPRILFITIFCSALPMQQPMMWTSEGSVPVDLHTGAGAMAVDPLDAPSHKTTPFERRFEAYDFNGGYV
jgi:hypothetical protein